jgi:hypothetical protein
MCLILCTTDELEKNLVLYSDKYSISTILCQLLCTINIQHKVINFYLHNLYCVGMYEVWVGFLWNNEITCTSFAF